MSYQRRLNARLFNTCVLTECMFLFMLPLNWCQSTFFMFLYHVCFHFPLRRVRWWHVIKMLHWSSRWYYGDDEDDIQHQLFYPQTNIKMFLYVPTEFSKTHSPSSIFAMKGRWLFFIRISTHYHSRVSIEFSSLFLFASHHLVNEEAFRIYPSLCDTSYVRMMTSGVDDIHSLHVKCLSL